MRRSVLLLASVCLAVLLASGVALAASPEDRDPTFDGDGRVVTDFSSPEELRSAKVSDVAVQPDGKIVLAGSLKGDDGLHDFALTRHLGAIFQYDKKEPTGDVTIDGGFASTEDRTVELALEARDPGPYSSGVFRMRVKNAGGDWTKWTPYETTKTWRLSGSAGNKRVYAQYRDMVGNVSATVSDSIRYRP